MARFALLQTDKDGLTVLHHNREAHRMYAEQGIQLGTDEYPIELPEAPFGSSYLFTWFDDLSRGRQQAMGGLNFLPWAELAAYAALIGVRFTPFERSALRLIDQAFVSVLSKSQSEKT